MKKLLGIVLSLCLQAALFAVPVQAEEDFIGVDINGVVVNCERYGQTPIIQSGRTLVPLRAVFEGLGATVEWDNETRTAVSQRDDVTVSITVGSNEIFVNGAAKTIDVPAQIINDRTMVPVRAVAEGFGCSVEWNNEKRYVSITDATTSADNSPEAVIEKYVKACARLDVYAAIEISTSASMFNSYIQDGIVDARTAAVATYTEMGFKETYSENVFNALIDLGTKIIEHSAEEVTFEIFGYDYFSEYEVRVDVAMYTVDISTLSAGIAVAMQSEFEKYSEELTDEEMIKVINSMEPLLFDLIDKVETEEIRSDLPVIKRDGKWLIYTG